MVEGYTIDKHLESSSV